MVKFVHVLFIANTEKVKNFDWFTTPYKGKEWAEHEWHCSTSNSMLLPSKHLCHQRTSKLIGSILAISRCRELGCIQNSQERKLKISPRGAWNIRNVWREKGGKKKEKLHSKFDPRLISRLVDISILGVWGCKKSCTNARAIVGQLGNHGGWGLFTEQVCKSCFYTTAELLVMFIEPTIQSNDGPRHFTAIAWYFVPAYLLQDAIYASSG